MGCIGFEGEDDSNKYKLTTKILYNWDAKVPKKLRFAMKKRGREFTTPFLPISKNHHHAFKTSRKKSKLNTKLVTKDEEEVAETLNSLVHLFSNTKNPRFDCEDCKSKSSPIVDQDTGILKRRNETKNMNSDGQQPVLGSSKKSTNLSFSEVEPNLCPKVYEFRGLSLSSNGALSFGTQGFAAPFENTNCSTQASLLRNSITADKYPRVVFEPKNSRKRCLTHVYIARLVKVLQIADRKDGVLEQPTHLSTENQTSFVYLDNLRHSEKNSVDVQNSISTCKRLFQDRPETSITSVLSPTMEHVQFPPYLSTTFSAGFRGPVRQHSDPQQQKWSGQSNMGRVATQYSPKWQNGERDSTSLNCAQSIFPHFHSNYRHFSAQQQQITPNNSSTPFS